MWSDWLVFCGCGFQSVCPLMEKDKRLMEASWWERLTEGETGSYSDRRGHAQYIFNPIFYWWVELCSLPVIYLGPNYGGGNEDNGDLLQKVPCMHCYTQCPQPCSRLLPTHASARDSWTLTGKSGSVSCGVTAPFSWVLVHTRFCLCPPRVSQSCVSSGGSMVGLMATSFKGAYAIPRSAAPRDPAPAAVHCWPGPLQETLKHSSVSVSVESLGPGVCLSPLNISGRYEVCF